MTHESGDLSRQLLRGRCDGDQDTDFDRNCGGRPLRFQRTHDSALSIDAKLDLALAPPHAVSVKFADAVLKIRLRVGKQLIEGTDDVGVANADRKSVV